MTDPTHRPEYAAYHDPEPAPGPEVLQLAEKVFNLARQGDTATLAAYVDAGVPANLCNDKGDTLVMLAAYHGHPQTVAALLECGADPAAGTPSAVETARMFGNDDLVALFESR